MKQSKKTYKKKPRIYTEWQMKLRLIASTDLTDFNSLKEYNDYLNKEANKLFKEQFKGK